LHHVFVQAAVVGYVSGAFYDRRRLLMVWSLLRVDAQQQRAGQEEERTPPKNTELHTLHSAGMRGR